jgi:uncharacterized membrane protein
MNKQTFMDELKKGLGARGVEDLEDILADYEEHFARKTADGYSEEETARKLGNPKDLANEYKAGGEAPRKRAYFPRALGAIFLDLIVVPLLIVAFAWVAGIAAGALAILFAGLCLIASPLLPEGMLIIPYMPYVPGALLGGSFVAFGLLFAALTAYSALLVGKTTAAYFRWHRYALTGKRTAPYAVFPLALNKTRRGFRLLTLVSAAAFLVLCTAAFVMMVLDAGNFEFWHVWGWFSYVG